MTNKRNVVSIQVSSKWKENLLGLSWQIASLAYFYSKVSLYFWAFKVELDFSFMIYTCFDLTIKFG